MVLLIIFGTRGVTTSAGDGEFHCPTCGQARHYRRRKVRRFFTLYFLPVVPLGVVGEYIECDGCKGTFKPELLSAPPSASGPPSAGEAEFHAAMKRVMVLMMLADGKIADGEIETIQRIYAKVAKRELSRADVDLEIAASQRDGRPLRDYLASLVGRLNDDGKNTVMKAAYFVAAADGAVTDEETALLAELASALEMSPLSFRGILRGAAEGR